MPPNQTSFRPSGKGDGRTQKTRPTPEGRAIQYAGQTRGQPEGETRPSLGASYPLRGGHKADRRVATRRLLRRKGSMRLEKIVIVGTGYVGFPLAVILARSGFKVVGVDIRKEVVRGINTGNLPIRERDIENIFNEPAVRENLLASEAVEDGDVYVISVPTPLEKRRKVADLSAVIEATESVGSHLRRGNLVILKSTVPPLTCREVITPVIEGRTGLKVNADIGLGHCPERILP